MNQPFHKVRKLGKGFKRMIDERVDAVRSYLSSRKNRIILGIIMAGTGIALIISGYIPMPE